MASGPQCTKVSHLWICQKFLTAFRYTGHHDGTSIHDRKPVLRQVPREVAWHRAKTTSTSDTPVLAPRLLCSVDCCALGVDMCSRTAADYRPFVRQPTRLYGRQRRSFPKLDDSGRCTQHHSYTYDDPDIVCPFGSGGGGLYPTTNVCRDHEFARPVSPRGSKMVRDSTKKSRRQDSLSHQPSRTSLPALWNSLYSRPRHKGAQSKSAGPFLLLAAGLILMGTLQQPLHQILISEDTIVVPTCSDTHYAFIYQRQRTGCAAYSDVSGRYKEIGNDAEPAQMAHVYHNSFLPRMSSDLASISLDEPQPNLWSDVVTRALVQKDQYNHFRGALRSLRNWIIQYDPVRGGKPRFFVASVPANSTTGVLRQHLMRLNSSVTCKEIDRASFPETCPGEAPFAVSFKNSDDLNVRICAPGKVGAFPWSLSRNRQDISEELYMDMWDSAWWGEIMRYKYLQVNATIRCQANTTRGYFELGNERNNNTYTPLLSTWPSSEEMARDFNDWVDDKKKGYVPSELYV